LDREEIEGKGRGWARKGEWLRLMVVLNCGGNSTDRTASHVLRLPIILIHHQYIPLKV